MSKHRQLDTTFWRDTYIDTLDPVERLLFLYFLTSPQHNLCGIYEIKLGQIALDTGIDKEMIKKILNRFRKDQKITYVNGYIIIKNAQKHLGNINSPKIQAAILREKSEIPNSVLLASGDENIYHIDTISIPYTYSTDTHVVLKPKPKPKPKLLSNDNNYVDENLKNTFNEKEKKEIEFMRLLWKENCGTSLRNHLETNLRDYRYLSGLLGKELVNYLKVVRMLKADQFQKRSLQEKLINYSGLRERIESVESYMQGEIDKKYITNKVLEAS